MRRRGQALLIVFGVAVSVLLITVMSYLLVKLFTENNLTIKQLNNYQTVFVSYTAQVDTNIMSYAGSVIPTLGHNLSVNCGDNEMPFLPVYSDYAHYQLAGSDYAEKFMECDIRGVYLKTLAQKLEDYVQSLSTGKLNTILGSVEIETYNPLVNTSVRANPYFFTYPTSGGVEALFIQNGSKFTVFLPNLTTEYDPGVKVCYSLKEQKVYLSSNCSKPVADYVVLRDSHQLRFSVDARPIYLYDYLATRFAVWNDTLHKDFDENVLIIPVNLENDTENSVIWHTDPANTLIPENIIGKWVRIDNLTSNEVGVPVYRGATAESEWGKSQIGYSYFYMNSTVYPEPLQNLVGYLAFYPPIIRKEENQKTYLFKSSCIGQVSYTLACALNGVNNYFFVSRDNPYVDLNYYSLPSDFDTVFKEVNSATFRRSHNFYSIIGAFVQDYGLDYPKYFDTLALAYMSDYPLSLDVVNLTTPSKYSSGISNTISNFLNVLLNADSNILNGISDKYPDIIISGVRGVGNPASVEGGNVIASESNEVITDYEPINLGLYYFTLLDGGKFGTYSPFTSGDNAIPSLSAVSQLKVGEYTLGQVLGSGVKLSDFNEFWSSLPAPNGTNSLEFRIHDVRVDYFYTLNLSNAVKVMIYKWTIHVPAGWYGIPNGTCTCYDPATNTTYNCTYYSNPPEAFGYASTKVPTPVTNLDGSVNISRSPASINFWSDANIKRGRYTIYLTNGYVYGGNSTVIGYNWEKYVIDNFPSGYSGQYVFIRRGYTTYNFAGCDDPYGMFSAPVYLEKVYVGVKQFFNVSAILSFKLDIKLTGKIYGLDYYELRSAIMRYFNLSDVDNYRIVAGQLISYSISGDFYNVTRVGGDIAKLLTDGGNSGVVINIPPALIFSSNLYEYIPFTVEVKNFPVMIMYKFLYGYPGRVLDTDELYSPNHVGSDSYNWFDVTGEIPTEYIRTNNITGIKEVAVSLVDNIAHFTNGFPLLKEPSLFGGNYGDITPPTVARNVHVHVAVVGSLSNTKVETR